MLNRLTAERPNLGAELANAARQARNGFGDQAGVQLAATLQIVTQKANELGVPLGGGTQALLDTHAVSIGDGAIALHDATGCPCAHWEQAHPVYWSQVCSVWQRSRRLSFWSMKLSMGWSRIALPDC